MKPTKCTPELLLPLEQVVVVAEYQNLLVDRINDPDGEITEDWGAYLEEARYLLTMQGGTIKVYTVTLLLRSLLQTENRKAMEIWQTYRNADETEGRGPMVPDRAFLHEHHAAEYIDAQPGVMGCRRQWSKELYRDWRMRKVFVNEHSVIDQER